MHGLPSLVLDSPLIAMVIWAAILIGLAAVLPSTKILNHMEEFIIAALMGAATLLIFRRRGPALQYEHGDFAGQLGQGAGLRLAVPNLPLTIHLSKKLQLHLGAGTLHLHVRMDGQVRCRLGVRQGIHVGVDVACSTA